MAYVSTIVSCLAASNYLEYSASTDKPTRCMCRGASTAAIHYVGFGANTETNTVRNKSYMPAFDFDDDAWRVHR